MNDSFLTPDSRERVFADFFQDLEETADKADIVRRYAAAHPRWAKDFQEEAAIEALAAPGPPVAADEGPDRLPDFRILREVARGGMGVVYEAEQLSLGRRVAVKVRRGRLPLAGQERFLREQRVLAHLHQTHIVPIHTAGQEGPWQYFAMAFVEGAALHHVVRTAMGRETSRPAGKTPSLAELAGQVLKERGGGTPARGSDQMPETQDAPSPSAESSPTGKLTLSRDYFESVARVMADTAEALHHAHGVKILHRDVKPSNIMVDTAGQSWLIDFGLARWNQASSEAGAPPNFAAVDGEDGLTKGPMGTPEYMAPEQYEGQTDVRSDVWGLGVTLYELLTLRRAFEGRTDADVRTRVMAAQPMPLEERIANVPADLAAICRKAMHKEPGSRYQTAAEVAGDLRRWLRMEPTTARPARTARRAWMWARRNKGWAAALFVGTLTLLTFLIGGLLFAQARATEAEKREQAQKRDNLVQQLIMARLSGAKRNGWSEQAWSLVKAAADIKRDEDLKTQAAATLAGLDAVRAKTFAVSGSAVAFDAKGARLLIGGARVLKETPEPAKLWDSVSDTLQRSTETGDGPVAFRTDGTPLQLLTKTPSTLVLWDVAKQRAVCEMSAAGNPASIIDETELSKEGSLVAAVTHSTADKRTACVWDGGTGKVLYEFPLQHEAGALAFSPDNKLLATGDEDGDVRIWSLRSGKSVALPHSSRLPIQSLAFSPDARLQTDLESGPDLLGRLAVGDGGAGIAIWNLTTKSVEASCRGSAFAIYALAFSPDGTILASGGRIIVKLWDSRTGTLLLDLHPGDSEHYGSVLGLAFSPNSKALVVGSSTNFEPGRVDVWDLHPDRGIQTLRGLTGRVGQTIMSPNGRYLAAFSHRWQVAIWDTNNGVLRHLLEVPPGPSADNAAMSFSQDSTRLAFSSYRHAELWNVESGKQINSWPLPPGYADLMGFHASGKLLLFRVETGDGKAYPFTDEGIKSPRVCRTRDLLGPQPLQPLHEFKEFNLHVYGAQAPADASYFAVDGVGGRPDARHRLIKAFDGVTGKELFTSSVTSTFDQGGIEIDSTGRLLTVTVAEEPKGVSHRVQVEMPSGKVLRPALGHVDPRGKYWLGTNRTYPLGYAVIRSDDGAPLVTLGIDQSAALNGMAIDAAHDRMAWSSSDGTVFVCNLPKVQRRLAAVGLGW
jgi:serine/threonine protein kinase/WD40 repeat protein